MTDLTTLHGQLARQFDTIPFNPFRGSGQGARQQYPEHFERVEFASSDGTPLVARLARHQDGRPHPAIVIGHGVWVSKEIDAIVDLAEFYFRNGWHALALDFQGHGESAKLSDAPYTMGWKESENLLGAAAYLRGLGPDVSSVALLGFSMAGAAVMLAEERARGLVDCLVVGSPPSRQEPHFIMSHIDKWLRIAKADPVAYFESVGAYYGTTGQDVRTRDETLEALRHLHLPTLLIQTADDDFIPGPDQAEIDEAAKSNPNVLLVSHARGGHGVELFLNDRYWLKGVTATFLKAHQAPDLAYVSDQPWPPLDLQLKIEAGWENLLLVTIWLRNSAPSALTGVTVRLPLLDEPAPAYSAAPPMFGPVRQEGKDLVWHADSLAGSGTVAGPFTIALPIPQIPVGTRLRTRVSATWAGPEAGEAQSNEASYTQRSQ